MAYSTGGSGGVLTDLMDAIRAFALGLGWTIDKWDSPNRLLFMTKGLCTVTMKGDTTQTVRIYSGASGANIFTDGNPDHRIYFAMGTSNNPALTTYNSHPGSPVTSAYDDDAPFINGLTGPYIGWHLFADPAVSDHIHVVVQISAEVFKHFSFGSVDKRGLTHSGVAYVTAAPTTHYRSTSNYSTSQSGQYNDPFYQHQPFLTCNTVSGVPFQPATYDNSPSIILKHSDAWPVSWLGPVAYSSGASPLFGTMMRLSVPTQMYDPNQWPVTGSGIPTLFNLLVQQEPAPYSNVLPLFPLPVFRYHYNSTDSNSYRICYVGDFPNVRACNMTNLTPGQEITVGSDTFMVFPMVRQGPWTDRQTVNAPLSGQLAIAYKKVP